MKILGIRSSMLFAHVRDVSGWYLLFLWSIVGPDLLMSVIVAGGSTCSFFEYPLVCVLFVMFIIWIMNIANKVLAV